MVCVGGLTFILFFTNVLQENRLIDLVHYPPPPDWSTRSLYDRFLLAS